MATRTPKAPAEEVPMSDEDAAQVLREVTRIVDDEAIYTGSNGAPLGLHARLAKIMASLPEVKPEGKNDHFKYSFVTDKQVLGMVRPRLAQQRIMVIPETVVEQEPIRHATGKGGESMITRLHVTFRVVDGVNGDTFTGEAVGYGDDSGDKGANKAYTAALKNFFIKLFLMGGADRDIEDDPETDRRASSRESGVAPVQQVMVKETVVEGVQRGGRSTTATEAQVQAVSRQVAALGVTLPLFAGEIEVVLGEVVNFTNWGEAKRYLEALPGPAIGKIIESFDEQIEARSQVAADDAGGY